MSNSKKAIDRRKKFEKNKNLKKNRSKPRYLLSISKDGEKWEKLGKVLSKVELHKFLLGQQVNRFSEDSIPCEIFDLKTRKIIGVIKYKEEIESISDAKSSLTKN